MKTKSEELFEGFLIANNVQFQKIKEDTAPRPDYLVAVGALQLVFEVKELTEDDNFGVKNSSMPHIESHSRTLGDHVRRRIEGSKRQIQYGAKQLGLPSVLLIYNNLDPVFQAFGTEDLDFT